MGILLEADYKGVLQGREPLIAGLQKAFSAAPRPANPLERNVDENQDIRPPETKDELTYETMNRDSAIVLAKEAAREQAKAFVYISAAAGAPVLPDRYISTKREAEGVIASEFPRMRGVFFRPPMLYDNSRAITIPLAAMTHLGAIWNRLTFDLMSGLMGAAGIKPLQADVVAEAVVEALDDESVQGPIEVAAIEELATKAWRKNML